MTIDRDAFERIRKLVHERTAIVIDPGKEYLVESRLAPIAKAHGFGSVDELCRGLDRRPGALLSEVVEAMTTNETSFFRDHHPFEALKRTILPEIIQQRTQQRALRVWCAACSTGQEPYSLCMLLDEFFPQLSGWRVQIYATDVSRAVLARAKLGRYRQIEVNRGLSASQLLRYFVRDGLEWEIRPQIRHRVHFDELNLIGTWPAMDKFDLIFLRNVLIYFEQETKAAILGRIRKQMANDGFLVLGGSETLPAITEFERIPIPRAGIYRANPMRPSQSNVSAR